MAEPVVLRLLPISGNRAQFVFPRHALESIGCILCASYSRSSSSCCLFSQKNPHCNVSNLVIFQLEEADYSNQLCARLANRLEWQSQFRLVFGCRHLFARLWNARTCAGGIFSDLIRSGRVAQFSRPANQTNSSHFQLLSLRQIHRLRKSQLLWATFSLAANLNIKKQNCTLARVARVVPANKLVHFFFSFFFSRSLASRSRCELIYFFGYNYETSDISKRNVAHRDRCEIVATEPDSD